MDESRARSAGAPNVLMIVLDDVGFGQLGCFGGPIATPHIDRLAESGLRYNNFSVTAVCSATRACLMTGRNHHRVGMGALPNNPLPYPSYTARLPRSAGTLPRVLRDAGYNTMALGKWHLTPQHEETPAGPFDHWPLGMGYERYYGVLDGMTNQWTPELVQDNTVIEQPSSPQEGYHLTEDLATQAIRMVQDQQQAAPDKPFFLYFATCAGHSPHHVPASWIEPYRGAFDGGWEATRREVFARQLDLGIVPEGTTLVERPSWVQPWEDLSADERRLYARMMEVYAGFITHTDAQIGRILDFLTTLDVLDNTLVMFLSDNGAGGDGGQRGMIDFADFANGGTSDIADRIGKIDDLGGFRTFNNYPWGWAWAGNTPLKLFKKYTWLGGIRVPFVVRWPAAIPVTDQGQIRNQFGHAIDLMSTILDAAGVSTPEVIDGAAQDSIDGVSLLPTLISSTAPSPRVTQYYEMKGSRALYHDGWKITTDHVSNEPMERALIPGSHDFESNRWSLFHLDTDFAEAHDLADVHPDRLRELIELWWHEAGRNQVLPLLDLSSRERYALHPGIKAAAPHYVYLPGGGPIFPPPFAAGVRLVAGFVLPDDGVGSGIICAQGSWLDGWACYLLDGQLTATFNLVNGIPTRMVAEGTVSPGEHTLEITWDEVNGGGCEATLRLDGAAVASGSVTPEPRMRSLVDRRLRIARDAGLPVCDDYQLPFPFSGTIHRVDVYTDTPSAPTEQSELDAKIILDD